MTFDKRGNAFADETSARFDTESEIFTGTLELADVAPQDAVMANKGTGTEDAKSRKKKASEK